MASEQVHSNGHSLPDSALACKKCTNGNKVTVEFPDGTYTFHSQWLHDARCDDSPAKNATTSVVMQPYPTVQVKTATLSGQGLNKTLDVTWDNGVSSKFPIPWLRVMAPLVARNDSPEPTTEPAPAKGWTVGTLKIPEISWNDLFRKGITEAELDKVRLEIMDMVLLSSAPGIVKVVNVPEVNVDEERKQVNTLVSSLLKRIFGSVFVHPVRGSEKAFIVSSHTEDTLHKKTLPNYDTTQVLLPHIDQSFYDSPSQVQGFYCLEGESENTWVSAPAVLETLKKEAPETYHHLFTTPMTLGRISHLYGEPLYQGTANTGLAPLPGKKDELKIVRWHPNLVGSLLAPYDEYKEARFAYLKFQEIMRRDTHQLKKLFRPGDLYIWDNYRLLHGRENVLEVPRTGLGQTVPEQVVQDRYRALSVEFLRDYINHDWLAHMPLPQLRELTRIVKKRQEINV